MGSTEYKRGSRDCSRPMAGSPRIIARPTIRSRAACRRARVRQGQAFGGAEEAPSLTATARDGRKLKLKESTLHSWIGFWRREAAKATATRTRDRTAKRAKRQAEGKQELQAQKVTEPAPTTTTEVQATYS